MSNIGQDIDAVRAVVVLVDRDGQAHAWDVQPVTVSSWRWTGLDSTGRSMAGITVEGSFRRKTRTVPPDTDPLEIEP